MRRRLLISFAALVLLIVGAFMAATLLVDWRTRAAVEQRTSEALGVPAHLLSARVSLLSGNFTLTSLDVSNPEGFDAAHLMLMNDGTGRLRLGSLFDDVAELPHLTLSGLELHLERREGRGNYDIVLEHLGLVERRPNANGREYVIRELLLRDLTVHVNVGPEAGDIARLTVPIDEMRLTDVGQADGGVMVEEIAGTVLKAIIAAVLEQAGEQVPAILAQELSARLGELDTIPADLLELGGERLRDLERAIPGRPDLDLDRFLPGRGE